MDIVYNDIGKSYNNTRKPDPEIFKQLSELLEPEVDEYYLDIGCGTGNYTGLFLKESLNIIGMDPSELMINEAKNLYPKGVWKTGCAESTGLEKESIHGIVATLTIHHWEDLNLSFNELSRVLKVGGKLVIFTSTPFQMKKYWLNHYFPKMMEKSILQMPSLDAIVNALSETNLRVNQLEKYFVTPDLQDYFLYSGKQRPALYLNPKVRSGISSFSLLSLRQEVEEGLSTLKSDIANGNIQQIIDDYKNDYGDYLFIVLSKDQ